MTLTRFNFYGQPDQPPVPSLVAVRAIARNTLELQFDGDVVVREQGQLVNVPSDRYTPVTWVGNAFDAANPANYSIARKATGSLVDPGEAVTLIPTYAEEAEEYWSEVEIEGTVYVVSPRVWVHTDHDHTARADYEVTVSNLKLDPSGPSIGATPESVTTLGWVGYVVSQVNRQSLVLVETLPGIARRQDLDGTGDLHAFFEPLQEVFNRLVEDVDAFFPDLCEIDRARPGFLDAILFDLGDPLGGLFDLTTNEKRKLIALLVQIYREKGTCEGVVNAVRFFVGVELSGCTRAWEDAWQLDTGSYPTPIGPNFELGVDTILGPGTAEERWSFWVLYPTPASLTADQIDKIGKIVDYMKPAGTVYLGIKAP
jgi:phage tail-like protein